MTKRPPWTPDRQGGRSMPWLPHVAGRYYHSQVGTGLMGSVGNPVLGILHGQPFLVPDNATYTKIAVECTSGQGATREGRLGIYNDTDGAPSSRVLDAGTVDLSTTGLKEITISQALTAGWYWLAYVGNHSSPVFRGWTATAGCLPWIGYTSIAATANVHPSWVSVAHDYAALPNPFGAVTVLGIVSTGSLRIYMKI